MPGLGQAAPNSIAVLPVRFEHEIKAVIELAAFQPFTTNQVAFLDLLTESIGIVLNTIAASMRTEELLKQSQNLTEELQKTNEELAKRSELLQQQKAEVERKNHEIEMAKAALEERAQQLALASRYKSEFLANMSHELRTPLNSLLILARLLADNTEGNLSVKQVEFARTIYAGGSDLLLLINDILDLSKIESGTMAIAVDEVELDTMLDFCDRTFRQVAQANGLEFELVTSPDLPRTIETDPRRVQQVLKNLLSNAFKFTDKGKVVLKLESVRSGWNPSHAALSQADEVVAFSVTDTGIGIPADKQQIIFEAFQQADGSTSRRYGGTGLGLSISREIARLLGADLGVASAPGRGSTFTFYLPRTQTSMLAQLAPQAAPGDNGRAAERGAVGLAMVEPSFPDDRVGPHGGSPGRSHDDRSLGRPEPRLALLAPMSGDVADDRHTLGTGDRVVLIIANQAQLAGELVVAVRARGAKALVAVGGGDGLSLARAYRPDAIALDLDAPIVDGWTFFERLKRDPRSRHVPIVLMARSADWREARRRGAFAVIGRPPEPGQVDEAMDRLIQFLDRPHRQLLICEPEAIERRAIEALLDGDDVDITAVASGAELLACLDTAPFDAMVLDPALPDLGLAELVEQLDRHPAMANIPILLYGAQPDFLERAAAWQTSHLVHKTVRAVDDLYTEAALLLHRRDDSQAPRPRLRMTLALPDVDPVLVGNKVLVVDDDVRNIFALTSMLERHGAVVVHAENGRRAIEVLRGGDKVDAVLMDIMMPEMDGYQTTREIRKLERFARLPIIALTAKAMKGDRDRCLEAGCSDYIAKPIEVEQLLGLLRGWLNGQAVEAALAPDAPRDGGAEASQRPPADLPD